MKNLINSLLILLLFIFSISCNKEIDDNTNNDKVEIMSLGDDSTIFAKQDLAVTSKYARVATVDLSKKIARVLYVMDYDLYVALGSNDATCSTYIYTNHNLAMKAFEAANIYNKIEKIIILKTPSVFTPITSAISMLSTFNSTYINENFNTKILIFNKNLGGYAFTNGINSSVANSLICGVWKTDSYWNSFNIAHELGHHYGSPHTHVCWKFPDGTTRRIDSCFAGCNQTNKKFTIGGTVMSYCYNSGTIKLPLVFHPLCIDTMVKTFSRNTSIPADGTPNTCVTTYTPWSSCVNNLQTRTFTQTGSNCVTPPADSINRLCIPSVVTSVSSQVCYKASNGKWRLKFNVPINASTYPTYAINVCRYDVSCTTTQACGSRGIYTITAAEKSVGVIDRELNPQPANVNSCYRTSISPSSGNVFWTPNFITN